MIAVHDRDAAKRRLDMHVREVEVLAAALLQLRVEPQSPVAAHDGALLDTGGDVVGEGLAEAADRMMILFDDAVGIITCVVVAAITSIVVMSRIDGCCCQDELRHSRFENVSHLHVVDDAGESDVVDRRGWFCDNGLSFGRRGSWLCFR